MSHQLAAIGANTEGSPSDAGPAWLQRGYIPSLDGLRAVAILMVLFAHLAPCDDSPAVHALKWRFGFLGVQLFFVLSGFLITTLMLREIERRGHLNLWHFYLRRVLRIVPAYLAYLAVVAVMAHCGLAKLSDRQWLAAATYTVNFLPLPVPLLIEYIWSLSVEEHFYLLWPLLVAIWPLGRCRRAALVCIAGALVLRWVILLTMPARTYSIDLWTFTRIDDLAVGCLLAFLARDPKWRVRLDGLVAGNARLLLVLAAFLVSQVCRLESVDERLLGHVPAVLLSGLANDCNSLTIAVLMWAAMARPTSVVGRVLNHRIPRGIGTISYSLYLWNMPFYAFEGLLYCAFPLNLLGSFLAAGASYVLIERPFLILKGRLETWFAEPSLGLSASRGKWMVWRRPWAASNAATLEHSGGMDANGSHSPLGATARPA